MLSQMSKSYAVSNYHLKISRRGYGCLFLVSVVCCQVVVAASD